MLLQVALAQTYGFRRDFYQLIIINELDSVFEGELDRRDQVDMFVLARSAYVGELLLANGVDDQIVITAMNADDHAFVKRILGRNKHAPAFLQLPQRVSHGITVVLTD